MKHDQLALAAVTLLAVAASTVHAQHQEYGRESVYAVPGASANPVIAPDDSVRLGRDTVYATRSAHPAEPVRAAGLSSDEGVGASVFATGPADPPGPVLTDERNLLQPHGRDTVSD